MEKPPIRARVNCVLDQKDKVELRIRAIKQGLNMQQFISEIIKRELAMKPASKRKETRNAG